MLLTNCSPSPLLSLSLFFFFCWSLDCVRDWLTEQSVFRSLRSSSGFTCSMRPHLPATTLQLFHLTRGVWGSRSLFLSVGLLLFPSWCRVSVRETLIFNVKQRCCVYRSNQVRLYLRADDLCGSVVRQSQQHAESAANSSLLQTSLQRKLSVCCLTV